MRFAHLLANPACPLCEGSGERDVDVSDPEDPYVVLVEVPCLCTTRLERRDTDIDQLKLH